MDSKDHVNQQQAGSAALSLRSTDQPCHRPKVPPWFSPVTHAARCASTDALSSDDLENASMTTLAEQFVQVLRQAGVERIYGVVGDSLNPIVDAVRRTDGIEWLHVRNEEAGAFAPAGAKAPAGEAQLTGRLAVCTGRCGPGNTHLIQG